MKIVKIFQEIENAYLSSKFVIKYKLGLIKRPSDDLLENRELTFEENFESNSLDRDKWNTCFDWGRHNANTWGTDGKNMEFKDGIAKFLVKYEPGMEEGWWGKHYYKYTVAHINSRRKFEQIYGKFEAKVKLTNIPGLFPAFWTLTDTWTDENAPGNHEVIMPEIDIFEHFTTSIGKKIAANYHCGLSYDSPWHRWNGTSLRYIDFSKDYHIFGIEWTKDKIDYFVDGHIFKRLRFKNLRTNEIAHRPMYLIINEHADRHINESHHNKLPDGMQVDWIRAYKNKEE